MRDVQYDHVRTQLRALMNVHVSYGVSDFRIIDFTFDSQNKKFHIQVDDRDENFVFSISDAVTFIREVKILDIKNTPAAMVDETKREVVISVSDENITSSIKKTVLDTIEKLKTDPAYIAQANAISGQIQTLINVKKLEMEMRKLLK